MSAAIPADVMEAVKAVSAKPYRDQAVFYLNAFWVEGADAEAETVWGLTNDFIKEDGRGKNGNELNPVQAFHLLQGRSQTLTALELKAQLRTVDIDANGEMSLAEYLLFINKRDVVKFIKNPQGGSEESAQKLREIEAKLEQLNEQFEQLQVQLEAQKEAEAASKKAEADAVAAEADAKEKEQSAIAAEEQAKKDAEAAAESEAAAVAAEEKMKAAEDEVRKVEEEARAADAELKSQQDAITNELARLEALTKDETVGIVKRNTAVQQLATLKSADPLPLQRAKITQEAVVRKVTKAREAAEKETAIAADARKAAQEARATADQAAADATSAREAAVAARQKAEEDRAAAVAAREAAEQATRDVEASIAAIKQNIADLEEELALVKQASAVPHGSIWFAEREVIEKKRHLPQRFQ